MIIRHLKYLLNSKHLASSLGSIHASDNDDKKEKEEEECRLPDLWKQHPNSLLVR